MGSSNNKSTGSAKKPQEEQQSSDPRGTVQDATQHQVDRFESQQGPLADAMAYNYGRGSEANYGDYTDIMNQYRSIASGGGTSSGGGGGGGGGYTPSYSAFTVNPERVTAGTLNPIERVNAGTVNARALGPLERVKASDPFQSYGGYQEFSQTGGYSPQDMANMRARGVSPIRAAYANAERNVGQQRSLQGGYSPNAIAAQVKMAREQGQGMADASQNVEAQLAQMKQAGRLAGLGGMQGIEGQRLGAQMQGDIFNAGQANAGQQFDITNQLNADQFNVGSRLDSDKFNSGQAFAGNQFDIKNRIDADQYNAGLNYQGQVYNANANSQAQSQNNAAGAASAANAANAAAQSTADRLAALRGMTSLYGTSPGMSETFGNQALNAVNMGGQFGLGAVGREAQGQAMPGQFDQTMDRVSQIGGIAAPYIDAAEQRRRQNQGGYVYNPEGAGVDEYT